MRQIFMNAPVVRLGDLGVALIRANQPQNLLFRGGELVVGRKPGL